MPGGREAIRDARWGIDAIRSAALIVGTSKGPVDAWLEHLSHGVAGGISQTPADAATFGLADTTVAVAQTSASAVRVRCCLALRQRIIALIRGVMMIRSGEAERVLVVAAESSLHPLFTASFRRLGVIAPIGHGCRPFDHTRAGFFISEAAAAVCLEATESSDRTNPWPRIDCYAMGVTRVSSHLRRPRRQNASSAAGPGD